MKYLLITLLVCSFTGMKAQESDNSIELTFENFAELQLFFEDLYTINKTTCFRIDTDTVTEVWMAPNDSSEMSPVTVLDSQGHLVVPFEGFDKYAYFLVDQGFVFYQTNDGEVGRYDFKGTHYVYTDYKELLDVRDGKLLVRRKDNMVGLVTRWQTVIVPFEYFHAWNGIQDNGKILFSRGVETWTHDVKGNLLTTGRL